MKNWKVLVRTPKEQLQLMQNSMLHKFINEQVYPFSPHYNKLFNDHNIDPKKIRTVADLRHVPFSSKSDFLPTPENSDRARDFILQPTQDKIKKAWGLNKLIPLAIDKIVKGDAYVQEKIEYEYRPNFLTATTGRSTAPVAFYYTPYDIRRLSLAGARLSNVFNFARDGKNINVFPYAPHLAFWQVAMGGFETGIFSLSTGGGKVLGTEAHLRLITRVKPTILIGVPGYIYHLIRVCVEQNIDLSSLKTIVLGAEKVTTGMKEKMLAMLAKCGADRPYIMGTYGFTEAKMAWGECPTHKTVSSGYHMYPDMEIIEVVDPVTNEVLGEGEPGEIVYTSLDARGSMVLRYKTGDITQGIYYEPCQYCGATVPRLDSRISRVSNIKDMNLTKIKGTQVDLNKLANILYSMHGVEEWQIEMRKKDNDPYEVDELIVYLALRNEVKVMEIKSSIRQEFFAEDEITPTDIRIISLDEMLLRLGMESEVKEKRFVDNRPVG
jgi:phenylacetate-coenzyme A ligase PaaK-like adenylate-forming protein